MTFPGRKPRGHCLKRPGRMAAAPENAHGEDYDGVGECVE